MMTILEAIAFGAASAAVVGAVYLAFIVGRHEQAILAHEQRLMYLERGQDRIFDAIRELRALITNGVT